MIHRDALVALDGETWIFLSVPTTQTSIVWNKAQKVPLDLKSTIAPVVPEPVRDLAKEIDELKAQVAINTGKLAAKP